MSVNVEGRIAGYKKERKPSFIDWAFDDPCSMATKEYGLGTQIALKVDGLEFLSPLTP